LSLFRKEVLDRRTNRLAGDVSLSVPVSWQAIGYMMLAALLGSFLLLIFSSYSKVETVPGAIVLDRGMAPVLPTRAGVIVEVFAAEGERVSRGAPLVEISAEEYDSWRNRLRTASGIDREAGCGAGRTFGKHD